MNYGYVAILAYISRLVVWNIFYFLHTLGKISSQLMNSIIFQRGWLKPPTRDRHSSVFFLVFDHGPWQVSADVSGPFGAGRPSGGGAALCAGSRGHLFG